MFCVFLFYFLSVLQLNRSVTTTLGTEAVGDPDLQIKGGGGGGGGGQKNPPPGSTIEKKGAVVERKGQSMECPPPPQKKWPLFRGGPFSGRSNVVRNSAISSSGSRELTDHLT